MNMIYAVYRILTEEPNKGYYWGTWNDPVKLAYACFNMAGTGVDDIKIVAYNNDKEIIPEITW